MRTQRSWGEFMMRLVTPVLATVLLAAWATGCAGAAAPVPSTQPTVPPSTPAQTQPPATTTTVPVPPPSGGAGVPSVPASVAWNPDGVASEGEYLNQLNMGTYRLFWTTTPDVIRVAMQSGAKGWVAVGFQPGTRMKNADIVFGMFANGSAMVLDSYSTGDFGPHTADDKQSGTNDVLSFGGMRTDTTTTFEWERRLDTGDALDVALQAGVPQQIIWAYGSSDGEKVGHSTRGYAEITP